MYLNISYIFNISVCINYLIRLIFISFNTINQLKIWHEWMEYKSKLNSDLIVHETSNYNCKHLPHCQIET